MRQDLLLELRHWWKNKAFAIATLLTLAVGIGGNTAIFSLVHAVMLKSLPVGDPQQLYRLGDRDACCVISGYQKRFSIFSNSLYEYLRDHTPEFSEMAALQADRVPLSVRSGTAQLPESFVGEFVSANYFSMFGVGAFAGRVLAAADGTPAAAPVAVMSYHAWEQRYGLDPSVIGSNFNMNGMALTIAGVAPPGFFGETLRADSPDFWLPLTVEPLLRGNSSLLTKRDQHWLYIVGRLRAGVQPPQVEARVNVELKQWWMGQSLPQGVAADPQAVDRQHISLTPAGAGIGGMKNEYAEGL